MKKGISLVSLAIVIIVMIILTSIMITSVTSSLAEVTLNRFTTEILSIQNSVDEYYYRYQKYPTNGDYALNIETIETTSLSQFDNEVIVNNIINFKLVNLSLLGINDTEFGEGNDNDIYVLSETTGLVYYLAGVSYEEIMYYTMTDYLYSIANVTDNRQVASKDVKAYDVIFTPSETKFTNESILVNVKIPKDATVNSISTTNGKSVSEEKIEGLYKLYTINETSQDKTGNYEIQINYSYGGTEKVSKYVVENYDGAKPQFSTLIELVDGAKIVTVSATDDYSGVRSIKYVEGEVEDDNYFRKYAKVVTGSKFSLSGTSGYTIYVEDNAGNYTKDTCMEVPETWRESIITMYDGVPIPKGFAPSQATGENTKEGGLVIYEGTAGVTDSNVYDALRNRNQYVWIPVDRNSFTTSFIRKNFGLSAYIASQLGEVEEGTSYGNWEVELDSDNMPLTSQNTKYMTADTLVEVQAMYASVKKYGGFYVARHEAGIENYRTEQGIADDLPKGTDVYSRMNKYPYTYIPWTWEKSMSQDTNGVVEVARSIYKSDNNDYGVVSTLIYGVQWDTILQWWLDTGAVTSVINSVSYGNYRDHKIAAGTANDLINEGASYAIYSDSTTSYKTINADYSKSVAHFLTTGALKAAKVNNIYDMAGNVQEYTMEGGSKYTRNDRGGNCAHYSDIEDGWSVATRNARGPESAFKTVGFRVSLYIK